MNIVRTGGKVHNIYGHLICTSRHSKLLIVKRKLMNKLFVKKKNWNDIHILELSFES